MKKWSWMRELRGLLSVGAALIGGVAFAGEGSPIPQVANPDAVFQPTGYSLMNELGCNPACAAPAANPGCCAPSSGCCGMAANSSWLGLGLCDECGILGGELGTPWKLSDAVLGECKTFDFGGWTEFGYSNKSDGVFETHPHHFDLQQLNMYVEKLADGSEGWGWGGRVDVMYGTDAQNTQSFGNHAHRFDYRQRDFNHGVYGWAIPQLYAEVAHENLSVKVGHFYTLLGYQVVPATGNFFYSIPFTFNFGEAFTHTGALATYKASDTVTVYGGYTLGWDTGFDQLHGGSNFLGGSSVKVTDSLTATFITTIGNLGWIGEGYSHSLVLDWVINDKWEYVFQTDTLRTNRNPYQAAGDKFDTVGVNQYLYYTFCPKLKAGGRLEWWKADGTSYNEVTGGFNIMPTANLRIRPEIRYQWSPGGAGGNQFDIPMDQTIFGIDAILTF